jgi:hypothetical protein
VEEVGPRTEMTTESARGPPHGRRRKLGGMVGGGHGGAGECGVKELLGEEQGW